MRGTRSNTFVTATPSQTCFERSGDGSGRTGASPTSCVRRSPTRWVGNGDIFSPEVGLSVDPYFMGCVQRLLDDGDADAFEDMRRVLRERVSFDDANVDEVIDVVVDVVSDSLGPGPNR